MPQMIVKSTCESCGEPRKFIEFKKEPCGPTVEEFHKEYGFRCLKCKTIVPEIVDEEGRAHRWVEGEHVEA